MSLFPKKVECPFNLVQVSTWLQYMVGELPLVILNRWYIITALTEIFN